MLDLYDTKTPVNTVAFSPDGTLLAVAGYRGRVQLWDSATGTLRARLPGCSYSVSAVTFAAGGTQLYGAEAGLYCWDVTRPAEPPRQVVAGTGVFAAAVSPDAGMACLEGYLDAGTRLAVYRLPGGEKLWSAPARSHGAPSVVAFAHVGGALAAGTYKGLLSLRDAETGAVRLELPRAGAGVKALAFSPDGRALACAASGHLHLWTLADRREVCHHRTGRTHFLGVEFHPSGEFLATANGDGKIDYWDSATGQHRQSFDWGVGKLHDVSFAPDGLRAACCSKSGHVILWDVDA